MLATTCAKALSADAPDPQVVIQSPTRTQSLARSSLLARPDIETVDVDDVSHRRRMEFRAIKMATLLVPFDIARDATLEFVATDGFVSTIPYEQLRSIASTGAIAYLAIEEPGKPWPPLPNHYKGSGGPFFLVWKNPHLSDIGREQWPYNLSHVAVKDSLERRYPPIQPAQGAGADVRRGYAVFVKNCLSCHSLNGAGPAQIAPDLNVPLSPTEYLREGMLRRLIRDAQSVRLNPRSGMPPFSQTALADVDLDALIAYLDHMAPRKVAITRP